MAEPPAAAADSRAADPAASPEQQALRQALAALLEPVARLAVARGLPYAAAEELLKRAFVEAASAAHPGLAAHRKVSRIATTTGINRREVTRLTTPDPARAAAAKGGRRPRSAASELTAHWRTHPEWRDDSGAPRVLPRLGPAPSFEALAQAITRDVHPRSLLDELCRLQLARLDEDSDTVALVGDATVPSGDRARMLGVLGANVGDHLRAAVDNVLAHSAAAAGAGGAAGGRSPHLEQALFVDGLSAASLETLRPLLREQWARLRQTLVPALEARSRDDDDGSAAAADSGAPAEPRARLRIGLYAYHEWPGGEAPPAPGNPADPNPPAARKHRAPARRPRPGPRKDSER